MLLLSPSGVLFPLEQPLICRPCLPAPAPRLQLLLDNALSAVDHHTAQHIFQHCVRDMFRDKAVVLVTHQVPARPACLLACQPARLPA